MQRKPTKNTRGPNADEKRFQAWLKDQDCVVSGNCGPSIVHHCEGATFKHDKTLVGHWFCIPLSKEVDDVITHGSRKKFRDCFGSQSNLWEIMWAKYTIIECNIIPKAVYDAIMDWNK